MKRLTMNRLAFSGIRANKKDYLLLGISAFLAIFAAVSTVLGTLALMQAATDRRNGAYGSEDAFVFDVHPRGAAVWLCDRARAGEGFPCGLLR